MDEEYDDPDDFDPTKYKVWDIEDVEGFVESFTEDELKDLYFWSEFGLRLFLADIKLNGNTMIGEDRFTLVTFPFKQIIHCHYFFKELLGEETSKKVMEQIETIEKAMVKDMIDMNRSN